MCFLHQFSAVFLKENKFLGEEHQFGLVDLSRSDTYGVPYDYLSVMHYPQNAFSNRRGPTIITKNAHYQSIIGTVKTASKNDYKKICGIYKCNQCAGRSRERPAPTPPIITPNSEEGYDDYDIGENPHCQFCQPFFDCNKSYSYYYQTYYNIYCCGICGRNWWRNWCNKLPFYLRNVWRQKGMCA